MTRLLLPVTLLSLALACTARGQAATQPQPNSPPKDHIQDHIQALVDAGQYQDALKAITQVLPGLGAEPAPSPKRYALQLLRGESLLQLKLSTEAIAAFTAAVREAPKPAGPPPADTPLDILDHQQRSIALLGLFYDLLIPNTAKLQEVKAETTLQPTIDFAPTLHTLTNVEIAATTTDTYSAAMNDELTTHAHDLMTKALASLSNNVDTITRSANESFTINTPVTTGSGANLRVTTKQEYKKHGLNGADSSSLADSIATCNKLTAAVKTLTTALSVPPKTFAPIVTEADAIRKKATTTLNADYSRTYTSPPR